MITSWDDIIDDLAAIIIIIIIIIMRKVQPFTIGTKLSIASDYKHQDYTPDLHLSTPSVTSEPGSAPSSAPPDPPHAPHDEVEEEEDEEGELLSHCVSSRSVRKIAICRSTEEAGHAGKSPPSPPQVEVKLSVEEEAVMKSTCEHLSQQEVNLALEVSLFYQRADIILSDISRTLSQSEDTRRRFDKSKASLRSSEQIDDIGADITVLDRCVLRLSELHPTLTARVRLKQKKVKTCWALLLQQHGMKPSDPPEALCSQFRDKQEEPEPEPEPVPGPGQWPGPRPELQPQPQPQGSTTLNKPSSSEFNQSVRQTAEEEEEEEESSVTLPVRFSPVRCDEHPDHSAGVTPLASSISVFLTFDPQREANQDQEPAESTLTPPPLTLVSRCVQVTGESKETHCCKDSSSAVEPSVSSSTTTFLPRVSTVILPPSPSDCSVSTLNLQPAAARTHRVGGMTGDGEGEGEGEDEDESQYRKSEASTNKPNTWPHESRTSGPPANTELLLYVRNNSMLTMETEDATGRLEITPGGDDTQVSSDSRKSCCSVTHESPLGLPTYTNDVSNFKSKQDTRSKVQQPPEDSSRSISPTTILSGLLRPQDEYQQVRFPSNSIRMTSNDNSENNEAEDRVKLPGVSLVSSFSLHPEEEWLVLLSSFVSPTDSGDDSYFRSKEDTSSSVSPATILSGLHQTQDQNQQVNFSSSTLRRTFNENVETKDTEDPVEPPCVSPESSFALHQEEEAGLALSFDPPTDHKDIFHFRSKEDMISSVLSGLDRTQEQNRQADMSPCSITDNSETKKSEDQVSLPGVSAESSSALHQEDGEFYIHSDESQDGKDVSHFWSKEDSSSSISPANILSGLQRPQHQNHEVDLSSSTIRKAFNENSETKEKEDHVKSPGLSSESSSALYPQEKRLALGFDPPTDHKDITHFRSKEDSSSSISAATISSNLHPTQDQKQWVDTPSDGIRKTLVKNEESEDQVKPAGVSLESLSALFPEEEANAHGNLSTLQPSGSSTIVQEDQGNKNRLIIQEGTFIQKTEPDSSGAKLVHHHHHCVSVDIKTCDLRGHIYQPITGHALLSTQQVDEHSASMSVSCGLRSSSRVVECLTEGCCICSAGLKSGQETESNQRPDPLSPDHWLFEEVEDELEDIWRYMFAMNHL